MRLVKLPLNCIVNLDNLNRVDFNKDADGPALLTINFVGDTPETNITYTGDNAERVWEFLCNESYVLV